MKYIIEASYDAKVWSAWTTFDEARMIKEGEDVSNMEELAMNSAKFAEALGHYARVTAVKENNKKEKIYETEKRG